MAEADSAVPPSHHSAVSVSSLRWRLKAFDELSRRELYALLEARVAVFVVEQECPYQEIDGLDGDALHLAAWTPDEAVAAYARILPAGTRFEEPSIGRVLTTASYRRVGLGQSLMRRAIEEVETRFPESGIRISAQCYLRRFYTGLGFSVASEPYDEDGIPHVDMRLSPERSGS